MIKKILYLLPILLLCGCYNYQEIDEIAIVTAIGIDKKDDKFIVNYQIVNPNKSSQSNSSNETDYIVLDVDGKSMYETSRKTVPISSRKLYGNHINLIIISEEMAKNDLPSFFDFIMRDPDIRTEFFVLVAKNNNDFNFSDLLKIITPLSTSSSKGIVDSLKNTNRYLGTASLITFNDLLNMYLNPNLEIVLPSIEIIGNKNEEDKSKTLENKETTKAYNSLKLSTLSVFKDNKLLGYLTEEESKTYNFIKNEISNTIIKLDCPNNDNDGYIMIEIISSDSKIKTNAKDNQINIDISGFATIGEYNCKNNLKKDSTNKKINKMFNNKIENMINNSVKSVIDNYNTDIFGFKDMFYKDNPKYFNTIKNEWNNILPNIKINVNSKIDIFKKGNTLGGIYE